MDTQIRGQTMCSGMGHKGIDRGRPIENKINRVNYYHQRMCSGMGNRRIDNRLERST